jgi:hypothetical protein
VPPEQEGSDIDVIGRMGQEITGELINAARRRVVPDDNDYTDEELGAMEEYTGAASEVVNQVLRNPAQREEWLREIAENYATDPDYDPDEEFSPEQIKEMTSTLDRLMDRIPLSEDMLLYRKMGRNTTRRLSALNEGDDFVDPGFMSTSASMDSIHSFGGSDQPITEIEAPRGSRAVPLGNLSEIPRENEVLIGRGTTYRVVRRATPHQRMRLRILR